MPPPLSIAIACKNNGKTLPAVLAAVRPLVEATGGEVVAVDSGSTDDTLDLLHAAGARVVRSEWLGHVRTKQKALDEARGPWVLCLDSDEPPTAALQTSILEALGRDDPGVAGYRVNRKIWYRGRPLQHAWQPEWRLRLVRKDRCFWTGEDPHDRLEARGGGNVLDLAGDLRHDSFETFADHLAKQVALSRIAARKVAAGGAVVRHEQRVADEGRRSSLAAQDDRLARRRVARRVPELQIERTDGEMIAFANLRQRSVFAEVIPGFAHGADHVGGNRRPTLFRKRDDFMIGVVERRADEVVHRGVHDDEILFARALHILDARDEDAGVAGNEPARLH